MWGPIEEDPDLQTNGPTKTKTTFSGPDGKRFWICLCQVSSGGQRCLRCHISGEDHASIISQTCLIQVGDKGKEKKKLFGVRAILGVRSRVFQEMLYGISTVFGSPQVFLIELESSAAIERRVH